MEHKTRNYAGRKRSMSRTSMILAGAVVVLIAIVVYQGMTINSLSKTVATSKLSISQLQSRISNLSAASQGSANNATLPFYNITYAPSQPPTSLADAPVVTQQQPFGKRLTNINAQLNISELSVINNASDSYFETAGQMYLNGTLTNEVGTTPQAVNNFVLNGKPTVIYFGSITCIFCGENRWAMALALGRFGSFSSLYYGYSSFGDGDLPTLYWRPDLYNNATINIGNFYNSSSISFISLEDSNPITAGFNLQALPRIYSELNSTGNTAYIDAFNYILAINSFQGTPYTIWGKYVVGGADAVDFGNTTPSSSTLPLANMTHQQVLAQLANPNDQFAWTEYAGADVYIALMCASTNNNAQVCSLPVIPKIESKLGVGS